jgi:hypothetical protein
MFAVLLAFLDESGIHDPTGKYPGSQIAGVGGAIAPTKVWDRLEAEWVNMLIRWQVPSFHMSECLNQKKSFKGWRRERAEELTQEAFNIIDRHRMMRVCGTVSVQDYDQLLGVEMKKALQHPYFFCLTLCINQILEWLPAGFNETVSFVCDRQDEFSAHAHENYSMLKNLEGQVARPELLGSFTYDSKLKRIPLQVADPIAYTFTRHLRRTEYEPHKPMDRWAIELTKRSWNSVTHFRAHNIQAYTARIMADACGEFMVRWN